MQFLLTTPVLSASGNTSTTCPYIGPGPATSFTNYTYLSLMPNPLDCLTACGLVASDNSTAPSASAAPSAGKVKQGGKIALLSPSSAGVDERGSSWACACADGVQGERYREPCGQASWYVVSAATGEPEAAQSSNNAVAQGGAKAQRRSRR